MNTKTKVERLAEHYDTTDTTKELEDAIAAGGIDRAPGTEPMTTFAVRLPVSIRAEINGSSVVSGGRFAAVQSFQSI